MNSKNKIRISEARDLFVDRCMAQGKSPATHRVYKRVISRFLTDVGNIQVCNVGRRHTEGWMYGLRGEHRTSQHGRKFNAGITAATFNQYLTCLRVFFQFCRAEGYINHDPMANLRNLKVPQRPRQQPNPQILLEMIESAEFPRDRAYLATACNTALRQSEILAIRVGDVNLETGFIGVVIKKTGDIDQQPISADLAAELRRWFREYATNIGRPLRDEDMLIPTTTSPLIVRRANGTITRSPRLYRPHLAPTRMESVVQAAMKKAGLATYYEGSHTIRRAVARAYFDRVATERGDVAALRETASLLHHTNLHTTERYLGMTPEKNRRDRRIKGQPFLTAMAAAQQSDLAALPVRAVGA